MNIGGVLMYLNIGLNACILSEILEPRQVLCFIWKQIYNIFNIPMIFNKNIVKILYIYYIFVN